ncbi:rhodanese-like domain-containing protein [Terasakiella sp. SH-1]|uniref:rhodanese-like domain-containing protein n=1 Tax=Terasakiella sp. SH-1 TaxID=2560057 RepID=UPI001073C4D1|nr:rhodanese-like domain-containing protein [Terasakiella sp. SH-1]
MFKSFLAVVVTGFFIIAHTNAQAAEVAPPNVEGAETIDVKQAKALHDDGALFIDLRMEEDFAKGHIPGSESLNLAGPFNKDAIEMLAEKDQAIVFYCYGTACMRSYTASTRAVSWGYTNIKYFRAGMPAWTEAGHPVSTPE